MAAERAPLCLLYSLSFAGSSYVLDDSLFSVATGEYADVTRAVDYRM